MTRLRIGISAMAAITLLALGAVRTAQADPALYQGTIRIPCCGNNGTTTPIGYVGPEPTTLPGPHGTGTINLATTGTPRAFTLPGGTLMATGVAYATAPSGIVQSTEAFTIENAAGSFFVGGGIGAETFMASTFAAGPLMSSALNINGKARRGNLLVTPGNDTFGGTMELIGVSRFTLAITGFGYGLVTGTFPIDVKQVGEKNRKTLFSKGYFTHTTLGFSSNISATVTGWKWTTGTVTVSDTPGFYNTLIVRSGTHDLNSAGTSGTIQLVSPSFWQFSSPGGLFDDPETGIFDYTLQVVPEPGKLIMLSGSLLVLVGLYRIRKKL